MKNKNQPTKKPLPNQPANNISPRRQEILKSLEQMTVSSPRFVGPYGLTKSREEALRLSKEYLAMSPEQQVEARRVWHETHEPVGL